MQERVREFPFKRQEFDFLRAVANRRTGIYVGEDKMDMFYSRLSRRVRKLGLKDFAEYCELIRSEKESGEVSEFVNAITTNLTSFFRENHHFEILRQQVLPALIQHKQESGNISVWSAGCSTGEEPYSIAISLREAMTDMASRRVRILASDVDSSVLAQAATAVYPAERVEELAPSLVQRWFHKGHGINDGLVRLKPQIREMVSFRHINLMDQWLLEEPLDVIFCRNVIIYFDKKTKAALMDRYAEALNDGGYLFVGHSESLFTITDRFELIGSTVYRKRV